MCTKKYLIIEKNFKLCNDLDIMENITIKKSSRRTISISINDDGSLLVRAPYFATKKQINEFILSKQNWIKRSIQKVKERSRQAKRFKELLDINKIKEYREKARTLLIDRTNYFSEKFDLQYQNIKINGAKTRWGSCNHKNGLNFNWKILLAPPKVLDYLVAHELAHTIHKNHQKSFWNQVALMHPEYKESRKWLRDNQHLLLI